MVTTHGVQNLAEAVLQQATQTTANNQTAQPEAPFENMFRSMVDQTTSLEQKASDAVTGLMNGSGVELHDAMIATQKADMSFELALQVRNKAVAAYQQLMNMQF